MKKVVFYSIVTNDHIKFGLATFESIKKHNRNVNFILFVVDPVGNERSQYIDSYRIEYYEDLNLGLFKKRIEQYREETYDTIFRWALKPLLAEYLLNSYDQAFWVDPDLYFFHDLKDVLANSIDGIILSPHWKSFDPSVAPADFPRNFYHGIYNAGFIGFNKSAIPAIERWLEMVLYKMEYNRVIGIYYEQGYLSLLHLTGINTLIIKNRGYNLASWNRRECRRELVDGKLLINSKFEVVFVHFTKDTIKYILNGEDKLLRPHLKHYVDALIAINPDLKVLKSHTIKKIRKITG